MRCNQRQTHHRAHASRLAVMVAMLVRAPNERGFVRTQTSAKKNSESIRQVQTSRDENDFYRLDAVVCVSRRTTHEDAKSQRARHRTRGSRPLPDDVPG